MTAPPAHLSEHTAMLNLSCYSKQASAFGYSVSHTTRFLPSCSWFWLSSCQSRFVRASSCKLKVTHKRTPPPPPPPNTFMFPRCERFTQHQLCCVCSLQQKTVSWLSAPPFILPDVFISSTYKCMLVERRSSLLRSVTERLPGAAFWMKSYITL